MKYLKEKPLYPFILCLYPAFYIYTLNKNYAEFSWLLIPCVISYLFLFLIYILFKILFKNKYISAFLSTLFFFFIFSFRIIYSELSILNPAFTSLLKNIDPLIKAALFSLVVLLFMFLIILMLKKINLKNYTYTLNIISILLISYMLFNMTTFKLPQNSNQNYQITYNNNIVFKKNNIKYPDIYYLIFDRYGGYYSLKQLGFDNKDFLNYLQKKHFYVAVDSRTNYPKTQYSLASSLNVDYLDPKIISQKPKDRNFDYLIEYNKVQKILKDNGYCSIQYSLTSTTITDENSNADKLYNYGYPFDEFTYIFLYNTVFSYTFPDFFLKNIYTNNMTKLLDNISSLQNCKNKPIYTFAHVMAPHPPYLFDKNGKELSTREMTLKSEKESYIDYVIYINKRIKKIIEKILADNHNSKIIIIQADEGPYIEADPQSKNQLSPKNIAIRTGILNAIYSPGQDKKFLYQNITPVNTFRLIFNEYFGTNFKKLEDKTFFVFPDETLTEVSQLIQPSYK